jgi:glycosyltransferase involved in cell wall biosynthesis
MKVLIVSQYFWPEGFRINELVQLLVKRGLDVDVLTGKPNYPEGTIFPGYCAWGCQIERWEGATIYRLPLVARGVKSAFKLASNYLSFIVSGLLIGPWILRKRRYDVIFVYAPSPILQAIPAIFLSWLKGCGVIVWVQDLWPESLAATGYVHNSWILRGVETIVRFIYRHADLLLIQSRAFEPRVAALAPGKKIVYYPNSVDAAFGKPPIAALPHVPQLEKGFCIVFAGNVGAGQAVDVIVDAAAALMDHEDIRFIIFGQGSRWSWMQDEVRRRGLTNLHLLGRYPVDTMPGFMQKASALLLTLSDQPIFSATIPNRAQAYMAAGRPILACLNGEGARLISEANAGLVSPAENAPALVKSILRLYQMTDDERDKIGANGRRYFNEHFDPDVLADELVDHFRIMSKNFRAR